MKMYGFWTNRYVYPYDPTASETSSYVETEEMLTQQSDEVFTEQTDICGAKKLLIELYPKFAKRFSDRLIISKEQMFAKLAAEMAQFGYKYTTTQVKYRWRCFERSYKNFIKHTKATGREYKKLEFYDELHDIFHNEPRFHPEIVTSSVITVTKEISKENVPPVEETLLPQEQHETTRNETNTADVASDKPASAKREQSTRKEGYKPTSSVLQQLHMEMKRKNNLTEKKLVIEQERNTLLERKLNLLEKYLDNK
ncbi:uncharacterized protein LOC116160042 isoform X2 [Photinus pyralis]|uniref:uncharacterized protein LOC116160042 isoform X2 n=1 Tax=Photinus pyralis TaxID=7054 RepID=UPI00126769D9|nr:uncharacterized protein LOC116160042 isoform X2 [Photinus pyralis]